MAVTNEATDITDISAVLHGKTELGGDHYAYFQWREYGDNLWNETEKQSVFDATSFSHQIDLPLIAGETQFEFRAVSEQNDTIYTGGILTFTSTYLAKGVVLPGITMKHT